MFNAGDHSYYLKISKHISYPLKFGWNIFVKTVTLGGLNGQSYGIYKWNLKYPPQYGFVLSSSGTCMTYSYSDKLPFIGPPVILRFYDNQQKSFISLANLVSCVFEVVIQNDMKIMFTQYLENQNLQQYQYNYKIFINQENKLLNKVLNKNNYYINQKTNALNSTYNIVHFFYIIQIQSIFTAPNVDIKNYKRGQITFIQLRNFRSITKLELALSPQINYVLGCNGVGKSSINMAILLACGSKNPELKDLIQEGKDSSTVIVWIANGKGQTQSRVVMRRKGSTITTDYYFNNQSITQNGLRKKLQSFNIYIDNPFMSMTQFDSQKILKLSGDKKLEFVQQLSNSQIKKLSYENMQKEFQDLDQCLKLFNAQRNEFSQAIAEYTKQNVLKELKILKKELRKNYFSSCYCDTKANIQVKKQQFQQIQKQYDQIIQDINNVKIQQTSVDDQIDQLKIKEQEQFREMNKNTQELEEQYNCISQQQYLVLQARQQLLKLNKMKEDADNINVVELKKQLQDEQDKLQEYIQKINKLQEEYQKYEEEIQTGTNVKQIDQQRINISQLQMKINSVQDQKYTQCQYGLGQLKYIYNDQLFNINQNNCNLRQSKKFVLAAGDTMIRLSKSSIIPHQTRIQLLMFTCSNILRSIYTNDREYSRRLEEINVRQQKDCTISYLLKYVNYTYDQFLETFKTENKKLLAYNQRMQSEIKQQPEIKQLLQQYNIQSFITAFEGNEYISNQVAFKLQSFYYLDKTKLKENRQVQSNEAEQVCNRFLQYNQRAIGIVFEETLYRTLKFNGETVGVERIKLRPANQRILQPNEEIQDIQLLKEQLYEQKLILQQLQNQEKNQNENIENCKQQLQNCKQQIQDYQKKKLTVQDQIEQCTKQINSVRIVQQSEILEAEQNIEREKIKRSIQVQRATDINARIINQYMRDRFTLTQITQLEQEQKEIQQQLDNLNQQQSTVKDQKQEAESCVNKLNYELQQQLIELNEFYPELKDQTKNSLQDSDDLYKQCQKTLKSQQKLKDKIILILRIDNPQLQPTYLQQYIQVVTQMLKQNASHQIHDLPQLQSDICKNLNKILLIYAKISVFAQKFIGNVKILNDQLEDFVQELSNQFQLNLKLFNVSGELRLNIWSENLYQKKFNDFLTFFTDENVKLLLGQFYKVYLKYMELCNQQNENSDDLDDEDQKQVEIKPINAIMDEFDQQTPDEFQQSFNSFTTISQLSDFQNIVNNLRPSLQIISRFSSGAKQQNIILSGGEQSVTTLCISACCKKVAFLLSDEINQNLDSKFEVAAHNLVCGLSGQAIISSPKIDVGENFDNPRVNIIILSKNYHSK